MKIIAFLLLCLTFSAAHAADVELEWDDPNPPGTVAAFKLEVKLPGAAVFTPAATSATTVYLLPNLGPGTYQARVKAATGDGLESDYSNVLTFVVPAAPGRLRVKVAVQTNTDGVTWQDVTVKYIPVTEDAIKVILQ
jgi:hypothetical protein